jgi:hypothetical protein
MKNTFEQHINLQERFINLFKGDLEKRIQYADEVWEILQRSYKDIGGVLINGMRTKEEMIKNIPFWKLVTLHDKVVAVSMFKDKGGRKRVALGTDGSLEAKAKVKEMMLTDLKLKRSWGEISGPSYGFLKKSVAPEILRSALIPVQTVIALSPGKNIKPSFGNDPKIKASDPLRDFWYMRSIGGKEPKSKLAIGTPGNKMY